MAKGEWRVATWRPEEQRAVDCGPVLAGIRAGAGGGSHLQSSKHEHEFRDSACGRSQATCHGARITHVCGAGVGSVFRAVVAVWQLLALPPLLTVTAVSLWAVYTCFNGCWSIMTFWWVGGLAGASGSGNRGTTGCGASTAVWCPGARSLWFLAFTKPKPGRHGARGTSWSYKCPAWERDRLGVIA